MRIYNTVVQTIIPCEIDKAVEQSLFWKSENQYKIRSEMVI